MTDCKRICRKCKHCQYGDHVLECLKAKQSKTHWSTGEVVTWFSLCDKVNTDGNCEMYEYQPTDWERMRPWFYSHNWIGYIVLGLCVAAIIIAYWRS